MILQTIAECILLASSIVIAVIALRKGVSLLAAAFFVLAAERLFRFASALSWVTGLGVIPFGYPRPWIAWLAMVAVDVLVLIHLVRGSDAAALGGPSGGAALPSSAGPGLPSGAPASGQQVRLEPGVSPGSKLSTAVTVLGIIGFLGGIANIAVMVEDEEAGLVMSVAMMLLVVIPTVILYLTWLYGTWKAVPEPFRSTTPGRAVGFLFIPFFNFYWIFRAIPGLSASIRRALRAAGTEAGAGYGVGVAACVMTLIPYVGGVLGGIPNLIWINVANAGKNRMIRLYASNAVTIPPAEGAEPELAQAPRAER